MSFIGKVGQFLSFSKTIPPGRTSTTYTNDTFLTNGRGYLVTAEIAFRREGSAWDTAHIAFYEDVTIQNIYYKFFIGIPFTSHLYDNTPYLYNDPDWGNPRLGKPHSMRQSARAYMQNGKINLQFDMNTDDSTTFQIYITAIQIY